MQVSVINRYVACPLSKARQPRHAAAQPRRAWHLGYRRVVAARPRRSGIAANLSGRARRVALANFGRSPIHLALRWVLNRAPDAIVLRIVCRIPSSSSPARAGLGRTIDAGIITEIDWIAGRACACR